MTYFWDAVWLIVSTFIFVAYLLVLFQIVVVVPGYRPQRVRKALWIIGLIFLPVMTALVYIIARGGGMAHDTARLTARQADTDDYIKEVAGKSPAEHIADAKALLDAGTITQDEFAKLKAKALA